MNEADILAWINTINDRQFPSFFRRLMEDRHTIERECNFVLGDAWHHRDDDTWSVNLIALPDPEFYEQGWGDNSTCCQSGECRNCGQDIVSVAKRVICPVCGSKAYCT